MRECGRFATGCGNSKRCQCSLVQVVSCLSLTNHALVQVFQHVGNHAAFLI